MNLESTTDEELLALFASSKNEAYFNELHRRYRGQLTAYIQRIHSAIGLAGAEDVVQQSFLSVAINHDQFDPDMKFGNWLFSIAANCAVNMRVSSARRPAVSFEEFATKSRLKDESDAFDPEDHREQSPSEGQSLMERNEHLRELVDRLPSQYRIVMDRLFFHDRTCEEAADDLSLPLGTVKTRLRWSLRRLREDMAETQELYRAA